MTFRLSDRRPVWYVIGAIALLLSFSASAAAQFYPSSKHGGNYMFNFYFPPAPSSTPWAPSWSPDGKWIAVAMSGSIWKVDPETGSAYELTYDKKYHSSPNWSPNSRWIVYTADNGGQTIQLQILDVETGESHALTNDDFIYTDPVFSPDGTQIAYVSTKPNGHFNLYLRAFKDGQWNGNELALTTDNNYGRDRLYFGAWDMHLMPSWMPSGKELLVISNRNVPLGSGNVVRIPAASGAMDEGRTILAEQTLYRTRPDVSIDGKRFIYSSTRGAADQFSNLYVQPTDGGEPYKMTFFSHDAFHPRWSPDGEWIAYISNEKGLPQLALLETYGGARRTILITERHWKRPMGVLTIRTVDGNTSEQTGSRIHLTASDGKFYAPTDAYARVSIVGDRIFHTPGNFTVEVPPGPVSITAVKGFEFHPETTEVSIIQNEVHNITIALQPMTNMAARGWYSGSTHVHMNYAGNLHNTLENLIMMSTAEDQDVINELIANKDNRILDHQFFVEGGDAHPLSSNDQLLVVGEEYRPPFYGHVFFLGLRDHLISPFTTGYEGTAIESLYPSNTDMLRKAKAQGATVGYVHAFGGESDPLNGNLGGGKGYMVDAALGTTDAVEWSDPGHAGFFPWYATLNNGLQVTAVGGEDSISNLQQSKLIGSVRTYVYTGARGLNLKAWLAGLRQGRAFVSSGPLIELTINGRLPGEEVKIAADGDKTVQVKAQVRSITPLRKVELIFNGKVIQEIALGSDRRTANFEATLPVPRSGWYHLRTVGDASERYPLDVPYAQAFTNPVWVLVGDQPVRNKAAAEYSIRWIDTLRAMAEAWPGWRSDKEKTHVFTQFDKARAIYAQFAKEAR